MLIADRLSVSWMEIISRWKPQCALMEPEFIDPVITARLLEMLEDTGMPVQHGTVVASRFIT